MKTLFKKLQIILAASLFVVATTLAQSKSEKVEGNGKITTKTLNTGAYDAIKCAGSMDFILVNGTEGAITLEGEENLLDKITAEVKDDKLKVKVKKGFWLKSSNNKKIKVTIPVKDISSIALAGSGNLWNEGILTANELEIALAGSGDVVLNIETSNVEGKIAGSGDLTLKGKTNNLVAKVAGSGDFHGFDLESNNTEAAVAGSGDVNVVSNKSLVARVAGSGDIVYRGNPDTEDTKVSGSGSIGK